MTAKRLTLMFAMVLLAGTALAYEPADSACVVSMPGGRDAVALALAPDSAVAVTAEKRLNFFRKWRALYARDFNTRPIGFTVGLAVKWWCHFEGGHRHRCTFFGNPGHNTGIVFGVPWQPYFKSGWGLDTGLFSEIYACKDARDVYRVEDINLVLPLRVMYRVPIKREFSVYASTGPALNVGLRLNIKNAEDTDAGTQRLNYNDNTPRRCNWLWDFCVGTHVSMFDLRVYYAMGMTPNRRFFSTNASGANYVDVYMVKLMFTASILF